jgi:hypothetical protein
VAAISNQDQVEATRLLELRGDRVSPQQRLPTGSMLFPDLVWARWAWQQAVRPHRFVRRSRFWRIRADSRHTRNAIPAGSFSENGRPTNGGMAHSLEQDYLDAADLFQRSECERPPVLAMQKELGSESRYPLQRAGKSAGAGFSILATMAASWLHSRPDPSPIVALATDESRLRVGMSGATRVREYSMTCRPSSSRCSITK